MNREQLAEELDRQIDALMQANLSEEPAPPDWLAPITRELRLLPNEQFHARLKQELLEQAESLESSDLEAASEILPSLRQEALPSFSTRQIA